MDGCCERRYLPNTELEKLGGESTLQMNGGRESRRPRPALGYSAFDDIPPLHTSASVACIGAALACITFCKNIFYI
jgi:hypothetical protein